MQYIYAITSILLSLTTGFLLGFYFGIIKGNKLDKKALATIHKTYETAKQKLSPPNVRIVSPHARKQSSLKEFEQDII